MFLLQYQKTFIFSDKTITNTDVSWIEVDLLNDTEVRFVATQGQGPLSYVSSYSISYSIDGSDEYSNVVDANENTVVSKKYRYKC